MPRKKKTSKKERSPRQDAYLKAFLEEVEELVEDLNDALLRLESGDKSVIERIFRDVHSIKGESSVMGFDVLEKVSHKFEDVAELIRSGDLEVTTQVVDDLLRAGDVIQDLVASIGAGNEPEETEEVKEVLQKLSSYLQGESPQGERRIEAATSGELPEKKSASASVAFPEVELSEFDKLRIEEFQEKRIPVYRVKVLIKESAPAKYARAYMVYADLDKTGEVIATFPDVKSESSDDAYRTFQLVLATSENPESLRRLIEVDEIERIEIEPVQVEAEKMPSEPAGVVSQRPEDEEKHSESAEGEVSEERAEERKEKEVKTVASTEEEIVKRVEQVQQVIHRTIRVDVEKLDSLVNLVGELVISRTRFQELASTLYDRYPEDEDVLALADMVSQFSRLTDSLQQEVMKVRMLPIEVVFNKFPRMVRDIAHKLGKKIELEIYGAETEVDKTVIEEIGEPLTHIIRNAIDHGIETEEERVKAGKDPVGHIILSAYQQGNEVIIEVEDDGRGIDLDKVREKAVEKGLISEDAELSEDEIISLIFSPGFSTRDQATDLSGRGVGLDVVKDHIERLHGQIEVYTEKGVGTLFRIRLPLTLAIIPTLLVEVSGYIYAIPMALIAEVMRVFDREVMVLEKGEVINPHGTLIPLVRLSELFHGVKERKEKLFVVIINYRDRQVGLAVDRFIGEQEIVIKALDPIFKKSAGIAGASILGDGSICLVLDAPEVVERYAQEKITEVVPQ